MSDVRAYAPGQTGTLADVVEAGPELRQVKPAGPNSFKPPATLGELVHSYRVQGRAYRTDFDEIMLRDGYAPIVDALGLGSSENPARFYQPDPNTLALTGSLGQPSSLATEAGQGESLPFGSERLASRSLQEQLIVARIRARRAKDPNFLAGVPDTVDGLHSYFREQEEKKRQSAGETIAHGPGGLGQAFAGLAGGGVEAFHDPFNIATLLLGGGGRTFVQVVARETLVNAMLEAATLPSAAHNLDELGEHLTAGEAVKDVVSAGIFGGLLEGGIHVGRTHVPPALFKVMPESVQQRWADRMKVGGGKDAPLLTEVLGDMDNRELGELARSTIGERMTPDERAAATVLERQQELGEASPFMPGRAGDGAHQARLADALKAIIDGAPHETQRGPLLASTSLTAPGARISSSPIDVGRASVPHDIVAFFKAKGLSDAHAYGIAAGIVAESRGDHRVVNPTSGALGLGQWLGSRKAEIVRRYGPNPAREQQLEFLWHELNGGDAGGRYVLAAKDPAGVLDAYIRKFMRPAAGTETIGDLERGMAALGRGGELPERAAGADAGDEDLVAALRRDADEAESEALELSQVHEDADLGPARELDAADYPILKRELFPSDQDWLEAQVEFYHSLDGVNGPQSAGNGPPAREQASGPPEVAQTAPGASEGLLPQPVYHGTNRQFDRFELQPAMRQDRYGNKSEVQPQAFFFSEDADTARSFAEDRALIDERLRGKDRGEPRVTAHRLRVEQPFDMVIETPDQLRYLRENGFPGAHIGDPNPQLVDELLMLTGNEPETWDDVQSLLDDPNVVSALRGEGYDAVRLREADGSVSWAVFDPEQILDHGRSIATDVDQVRIDDPELKAFDDGGSGRKEQVESLEHDLRMQAEEQATAHLERRFAELGPEPKRPRDFAGAVKELLRAASQKRGIAYRIDADDAISHGVDADAIYVDPKAKYPRVKVNLSGIFSSSKAPLRSRSRAVKLRKLDWLGDRVDPRAFGVETEGRLEPEQIAELLHASIEKSPDALDRSDTRYQAYADYVQQHDRLMALDGEPAHPITGETLPEALARSEALRESFPAAERGGSPGTHNIVNSEPAPGGGTRGELRLQIFNALLAKPARAERQAHLVLGPPAAGKSSVAEPLAEATGSRLIDADDAKAMLPEFEDGIGANAVHEESSRLAAVAADATIRKGENVVLPLVGRTYDGVAARIEDLVKAGYNVHVHLVDLPGEKAVDRAIARFAQTGRLVDPNYVHSVGDAPRDTFARIVDAYKDQLGGHVHVTNDVPFGEKPRLVEASSDELAARFGFDRAAEPGEGAQAAPGGSGSDGRAAPEQSLPELDRRYRLAGDGEAQSLSEILAELDAHRASINALRSCAGPAV